MSATRPLFRGRHRNANGQMIRKRGTTRVRTLRRTYGRGFAPGLHGDVRLSDLLAESGAPSLRQYLGRASRLRRASRQFQSSRQWSLPLAA